MKKIKCIKNFKQQGIKFISGEIYYIYNDFISDKDLNFGIMKNENNIKNFIKIKNS